MDRSLPSSPLSGLEGSDDENNHYTERPSRKIQKTEKLTLIGKYQYLRNKLYEDNSNVYKGNASELVLQHLNELKDIYEIIQREHNRDARVHLQDSEAFMDTSKFAAINARNTRFGDSGISLNQKDFISRLKYYMNPKSAQILQEVPDLENNTSTTSKEELFNSFNWPKLGALFYSVSRKAIVSDTLNGPLEVERKRPSQRVHNIDDTKHASSSTASQVQAFEITEDEEQNTAQMVKKVYQIFLEKRGFEETNFFEVFINPYSFPQSVENLFFLSFLIKDAKLSLRLDDNGIPLLQAVDSSNLQDKVLNRDSQNSIHEIASLDYVSWKNLIEKFGINESFLGNRKNAYE